MVWAAIWGKSRSDLVCLERDCEAKKQGYTATSYISGGSDHPLAPDLCTPL
jgi:hypothetical protein